ncbi:hypothetical protein NA56DRAFT_713673 [Hyaloscypha hepaticicola]|uniref:Uncharacterized protein n=1 Tax=Hyaloscypha hepaticicola TaxID=2082293 RepID=A0A2J6PD91_9HELO|nr:hypothetical protein NA56DRAFT_713673 [Hyaloscypha hepaticicola]
MARHNQQALDFSGSVRPRARDSPTPLAHSDQALPKRSRALTTSIIEPTVPPYRRTRVVWKALVLKPTNSYMFKGVYSLYTRYVIEDQYAKMLIRYSQPDCKYEKVINRVLYVLITTRHTIDKLIKTFYYANQK